MLKQPTNAITTEELLSARAALPEPRRDLEKWPLHRYIKTARKEKLEDMLAAFRKGPEEFNFESFKLPITDDWEKVLIHDGATTFYAWRHIDSGTVVL